MVTPSTALNGIPTGLRDPLLQEYSDIVNNFMEAKMRPAELSAGRFCEIVYCILDGKSSGIYAVTPLKPSDFVSACRRLEQNTHVPRSFQILIPRLLPALYEIRNNRNVGHVGGDVVPDFMDANAVVAISGWIMAELVRVYHALTTTEAQAIVDDLVERRTTFIWKSDTCRRVLKPDLKLTDQMLLLIASTTTGCNEEDLFNWVEYKNRGYFKKNLQELHTKKRFIEFNSATGAIILLPPGAEYVTELIQELTRL
jgi:hypothetical protein